ncbi:hypothetical protein RCL1_004959 [Eukaryota sp. TZLM3-RCL]
MLVEGFIDAINIPKAVQILKSTPTVVEPLATSLVVNVCLILFYFLFSLYTRSSNFVARMFVRLVFVGLSITISSLFQAKISKNSTSVDRSNEVESSDQLGYKLIRIGTIVLYTLQSKLAKLFPLSWIPMLIMSSFHASLYSFELLFKKKGLSFDEMIAIVERNWLYFLGFGFPLATILQLMPNSLSFFSFPIFLPFFVFMAHNISSSYESQERVPSMKVFALPLIISKSITRQIEILKLKFENKHKHG